MMGTSPFDPRVKRTHSTLQMLVAVALRNPLTQQDVQDGRLEEDAQRLDREDEIRLSADDFDLYEESFEVDD